MSARYFAEFRCLIAAAMLSLALLSHADAKEVPVVVVPFPRRHQARNSGRSDRRLRYDGRYPLPSGVCQDFHLLRHAATLE